MSQLADQLWGWWFLWLGLLIWSSLSNIYGAIIVPDEQQKSWQYRTLDWFFTITAVATGLRFLWVINVLPTECLVVLGTIVYIFILDCSVKWGVDPQIIWQQRVEEAMLAGEDEGSLEQ